MSNSEQYQQLIIDFNNFITQEGNNSIILSAPFGSGKTHFIKKFQSDFSGSYHYFTLNPINYSVSANEDVFELIKYDILIQILANQTLSQSIDKSSFHWSLTAQMFLIDLLKPEKLLSKLASILQHKSDFNLKALGESIKEMQAYHEKVKTSEIDLITTFLNSIESQKGSPYEFDAITQIINSCLSNQEKKSFLIIDDFDRLDPEHVFRILNLLISYNDYVDGKNKLGFSKVVLICDIENIRSIFHHKYGKNTDFSGYLDKFYSKGVYEFNNVPFANQIIKSHLETIRFRFNELDTINVTRNDSDFRHLNDVIVFLVFVLFHKKATNLRAILKLDVVNYNQYTKPFEFNFLSSRTEGFAIWVIFALAELFPSKQLLLETIKRLATDLINDNELLVYYKKDGAENISNRLSEFCLSILIPANELNESYRTGANQSKYLFQNSLNEKKFTIRYSVSIAGRYNNHVVDIQSIDYNGQPSTSNIHLSFLLLYEACVKLIGTN